MKLDTARKQHQELVRKQLRLTDKRIALLKQQMRNEAAIDKMERALARSEKRLAKLVAAKTYTAGPTASAVPELIDKIMI